MPSSQRCAVVGPGAIGGVIASRLARAGHPLLVVGRNAAWLARIKEKGLDIKEGGSTFHLGEDAAKFEFAPEGPECDCVFVCVKSQDVPDALKRIARLVGPKTAVIALQNGLKHPPLFEKKFGAARVVIGSCFIAVNRTAPSEIEFHGGQGIHLARGPKNKAAFELAVAVLRSSGWAVFPQPSADSILWTKLIFNASVNPLAALTGRTNGEIATIPALRDLLGRAVRETAAVAKAAKVKLPRKNLERDIARRCVWTFKQINSMLQDIRSGRPTELDAIVKPILDLGRRKKVPTPTLSSLYDFTRALEAELCR